MKSIVAVLLLAAFTLTSHAEVRTRDVVYHIDGEEFTGYLAWDDALGGPRPGVLVFPEWWGLSDYERARARMLAELGYVALAVDMYGTGRHTADPEQAKAWMQAVTIDVEWWRERALKGLEVLRADPLVDADNVAAIGYCFGGGTVLQLAYSGADVEGVVSFHGSLPAPDEESLAAIEASILVLHGNADPFVADAMVDQLRETLEAGGVDWQLHIYGGVRHSFTNPGADERGMDALKYDATADDRSWAAMKTFFAEIFTD